MPKWRNYCRIITRKDKVNIIRGNEPNGVNCPDCGIAGEEKGVWKCYKYNCTIAEAVKIHKDACPYFIKRIFEDGEPLTPQQHLLMSEQELSSRHMKGPV